MQYVRSIPFHGDGVALRAGERRLFLWAGIGSASIVVLGLARRGHDAERCFRERTTAPVMSRLPRSDLGLRKCRGMLERRGCAQVMSTTVINLR